MPGSIKLHGATIDPARTYRVTVNTFLAFGGDNFSVFAEGRKIAESETDLDVLIAYFRANDRLTPPALDRIKRRP